MSDHYSPIQRAAILDSIRNSQPGAGATERIRIRRDTSVEAYGRMPNTNEHGWWFAGLVADHLPPGDKDRHQGRKPINAGEQTVTVSLRLTVSQRAKLATLGGAKWVRARLDEISFTRMW